MTQYFECRCGEHSESRTCVRCYSRLRGMLESLPEQYAWLHLSRQRPQSGGGDRRSSRALHAPTPGDERVLNLLGPHARQSVTDGLDQTGPVPFLGVLEAWCEVVVEERRLTAVRRDVSSMTTLLTQHLRWIAEQVWVGDFEEEIRGLLRTTRRITLTEPRRELLTGVTCPSCDGLTLVRYYPGDWAAQCVLCPSVRLNERDYQQLVQQAYQAVSAPGEV
ncbi:hypothetical protein [Streptomyces spiralis]